MAIAFYGDKLVSKHIRPGQKHRDATLRSVLLVALALQTTISIYWLFLIPLGDEAIHIYNATRVAQGEWPYKDFFSYLTPGAYLVGGYVLSLFSEKIIALRVLMLIFAIIGITIMYKIVKIYVADTITAAALLLVYTSVTALTSTYFTHHNFDNLLFVILLFATLVRSSSRWYYLLIGIIIAFISLVHQAHGFFYFIVVIAYILFAPASGKMSIFIDLCKLTIPSILLYTPLVAFLILTGSVHRFIEGVVVWNVTSYANNLAFGIFEHNIYNLSKRINLVEEPFFLLSKILVIIGGILLSLAVVGKWSFRLRNRKYQLAGLLILMLVMGNLQTMHNPASQYVLFFICLIIYVAVFPSKWVIALLVLCTIVQQARVVTFPIRYFTSYSDIRSNTVHVAGNRFFRNFEVDRQIEINQVLQHLGIRQAIVVGRSPELYILSDIRNPTRYDIILPRYLTSKQLDDVIAAMRINTVIYDLTLEKLSNSDSFFDDHHYKKNPFTLPSMESSALISLMKAKRKVYDGQHFSIYQ